MSVLTDYDGTVYPVRRATDSPRQATWCARCAHGQRFGNTTLHAQGSEERYARAYRRCDAETDPLNPPLAQAVSEWLWREEDEPEYHEPCPGFEVLEETHPPDHRADSAERGGGE